jgi:hypothetical protein
LWGAKCRGGYEPWCEREAQEVNAPVEAYESLPPSDDFD